MTTKEIRRNYLCFTINKYEQKCCERARALAQNGWDPRLDCAGLCVHLTHDAAAAIDRCFRQSIYAFVFYYYWCACALFV